MERPDDQTDDSGLPQPGSEEPEEDVESSEDETEGPGNVSVDEPTAPALAPEEIEQESSG
jgi:hypothetical protein